MVDLRLLSVLFAAGLALAGADSVDTSDPRRPGPASWQGARTRSALPAPAEPVATQETPEAASAAPLDAPMPGARSARNASYQIDAELDPDRAIITGHEIITWRNIARAPAAELQFHLYYNAWKNTQTTWMREDLLGGRHRAAARDKADDWGWTDVTAVRLAGTSEAPTADLTSTRRFIQPDDGNGSDQTVMAIALPAPVESGHTVRVEIDWTAHVPRTFARTGRIGRYYFLAQWFPKIGVFEDAGWNCHQFHAGTEFFADYGAYDVRLTVPRGWVVGATGVERERRDSGSTTLHRFLAEDVHDFAWTTSPDYVERRARFEHLKLPSVEMRLLLQPEHLGQAERHFAATRAALRYYGEWFGPYPYGHITIVDPAWRSGTGGMEYPTLFTAGTRWLAPSRANEPEGVTVHECGHQFWYAIVGNNEFEHAWLDEGLNTYSTGRVMRQFHQPNYLEERFFGGFVPYLYRDIPLTRDTFENGLDWYRTAAESDVPATPSWRYWPATGGALSYSKTALWLHTLERHLGWPLFQRVMSTYFDRWKFRHPKPDDFFTVVNEVTGRDMTWFFDQAFRSSNVFDYGVQDLQSVPTAATGLVDQGGRRQLELPDDGPPYETQLAVRRYGEAVFPVEVLVTFENGEQVRERWDGKDRWRLYTWRRAARARSAEVDPGHVLLLDINRTNNSATLAPANNTAATRWMWRWLVWLQDRLMTYAFFV